MPDNAACQQDLGHPDLFRWFELWSECTWQCRCDIDQKQKATGLDRLASLADRLSAIPEADISSSASEDGSSRERSRFPSYPYISRPPGSDSEDMQSRGAIEQPAAVEADHEPFSFSAAEQCAIQRQAPCKCKGSCTSVAQACAYGGSVCKCTAKPFFQSGPFGQFRGQCGGVIKGRWRRKSKRQLGIRPIKINGVAGENSTTVDLSGAVDVRPGVTAAARQGDERSVNSTARGNGSTYDDYARGGRNLTLSIANATISNGSRLEDLGTVFLDSETGEQVACPCNESYVSYACCATEDGMLWEPAHHKLGTLLVETA
ncbi:MAG: hypothetical protein M1817_004589 [Caeruleum heppii]|nr:MAG: hypothetical protein M1817_004589 [Caeruleum heppii]